MHIHTHTTCTYTSISRLNCLGCVCVCVCIWEGGSALHVAFFSYCGLLIVIYFTCCWPEALRRHEAADTSVCTLMKDGVYSRLRQRKGLFARHEGWQRHGTTARHDKSVWHSEIINLPTTW